jgi:sulfonate transport system permease protein
VLQLSRRTTLWQVVIPSALPSILIGLRYALMYSVFGLIIAEQLGSSNGLGYLIANAQIYAQFKELMAVAVIYAFFGVLANLIARGLERLLVPWAYTRKDRR